MNWTVRCPAKINTFLSVGPIDSRGWHPLRTIFQAVDLCDTLQIQLATQTTVESNASWLPAENSITKAISLLQNEIGLPPLHVKLQKEIPCESGLGGGSSDAAGILRIGQEITGNTIPKERLIELALKLGADVPFFLFGGRASAKGYGEILEPLDDLPTRYLVLARPQIGCPTPQMFRDLDRIQYEWRPFPNSDELYNDFERVAPQECLALITNLKDLGADDSGLTGSGSVVFGRFKTKESAQNAALSLTCQTQLKVWTVRTLSRAESI